MKRIIALALALLLLAGTAAAEWPEGMSPAKPYEGVPEVDLQEQMGYMMFYPRDGISAGSSCQRLYIYLPREDVKAGDGTLYLFTEKGDEVWSTAMNDTEAITVRSINDAELTGLLWGGGTCFEVLLPRTLELGKTYYVNLTRGCIVAENGVENPQLGGKDWAVKMDNDYGVSGMQYRREQYSGVWEDGILHPQAGDEIRFNLVLGGEAKMAAIYQYNDSADFLLTTYEKSSEVVGKVASENLVWGVMFLDAWGNELSRVEFW